MSQLLKRLIGKHKPETSSNFLLPTQQWQRNPIESEDVLKILNYFTRVVKLSSNHLPNDLMTIIATYSRPAKTLVLNLDKTLIYSSLVEISNPHFTVSISINNTKHSIYILKRPYLDKFLEECNKYFEIVLWSGALKAYVDLVLEHINKNNVIKYSLYRNSCSFKGANYVRDLSKLGRNLRNVIMVSYEKKSFLQVNNGIVVSPWINDETDTQLLDLLGILKVSLFNVSDVTEILDANKKSLEWLCNQVKSKKNWI